MLNKITNKGDWETSKNTVTTKGGGFVGYAKKETDAKMFAAAPKLLEIIEKHLKHNMEVKKEIETLFDTL